MTTFRAIASGLIGAVALNLVHESARHLIPKAPHIEKLGERALTQSLKSLNVEPPTGTGLYVAALAGDVISNGLYYGLIGMGKSQNALRNGVLLGLAAGVGGVLLPGPMGLGKAPTGRTPATAGMTVGWYLIGGIAAALAYQMLSKRSVKTVAETGLTL